MSTAPTRESSIEAIKDTLSSFPLNTEWVNLTEIGAYLWAKHQTNFNPNLFGFSQTKLLLMGLGVFTTHIKQGKTDTWIKYKPNRSHENIVFPEGPNAELLARYPVVERPDALFCAPVITPVISEEPRPIVAPVSLTNHIKDLDRKDAPKNHVPKRVVKPAVLPFKNGGALRDIDVAKKLIHFESSANSRGLEFDLSFKTIKKIMNTKKCFYTGIPFTQSGVHQMSVDRVDASKGYIEGNVVPSTIEINNKKTNLTIAEILLIAKKVIQLQKAEKKSNKLKKAKAKLSAS